MAKFKVALAILVLTTIVAIGLTVYAATAPTNETPIQEDPEVWVTPALPENIRRIAPIPAWVAVSFGWLSVGVVAIRRRKRKSL
jgi:hypothetical protein